MTAPYRLRAPDPYELDIHESLAAALDILCLPPMKWACYPAGHVKLTPRQGARLKRVGLKPNIPDCILWYFGTYGLEVKAGAGKLSKTRFIRSRRGNLRLVEGQTEGFAELMATGAWRDIATVHSVPEAVAQIVTWGLPLRSGPYLEEILREAGPLAEDRQKLVQKASRI